MGIAIIAFSWAPIAAEAIACFATWLTRIFNYLVAFLQSVNPRSFSFLTLTGFQLALLVAVICGIGYYLLRARKQALFTALASAVLLLSMLCADKYRSLRQNKLIVYNTGNAPTIERIIGNWYQPLTAYTPKARYAVGAAHIAMRAWRRADAPAANICAIGGRTIVTLQEPVAGGQPFPADVVVIATSAFIDAKQIISVFSPHEVVIAQGGHSPNTDALLADLAAAGIKTHTTATQGAWIAE